MVFLHVFNWLRELLRKMLLIELITNTIYGLY
jgi:hypothetical protein